MPSAVSAAAAAAAAAGAAAGRAAPSVDQLPQGTDANISSRSSLCVLAEFKYDGQRAQIHVSAEREVRRVDTAECVFVCCLTCSWWPEHLSACNACPADTPYCECLLDHYIGLRAVAAPAIFSTSIEPPLLLYYGCCSPLLLLHIPCRCASSAATVTRTRAPFLTLLRPCCQPWTRSSCLLCWTQSWWQWTGLLGTGSGPFRSLPHAGGALLPMLLGVLVLLGV
jgi:hypothetical protein